MIIIQISSTYNSISKRTSPPPPIEPGGTHARSPSPEPPYLWKRIYLLSWVLVTIGNYKKNHPTLGFLGKSSRDCCQEYPISLENGNAHAPPYALEWGGGGGGDRDFTPSDMHFSFTSKGL